MNILFELLQMALGTRERLSRVPSSSEWEGLYDEADRQAIVGLLLCGLERLPAEQLPPLEVKLQWIGETQMVEFQNKVMDKRCVEMLGMLEKAGLRGTVLKDRFHALTVADKNGNILLDNAVIDFKHYFTVPPTYLFNNRKNRLFHLDSLFAEQITLKFATFLSRVAIP